MKSPMRIKVPASVSMVLPESTPEQAEIARRWDEVRAEMGELLRSLQPSQLQPVPASDERMDDNAPGDGISLRALAPSWLSAETTEELYSRALNERIG